MRITPITPKYYSKPQINFTEKKKEEKKDEYVSRDFLKAWAAGTIAGLAIAYGGGQIMLNQYRKDINRILDKYEQELKIIESQKDSIDNEAKTIFDNYDTSEEP